MNDLLPFARMALAGIQRRYPYKVAFVLEDDDDARPPAEVTPVFAGCFDWHSAVHAHWTLARVGSRVPAFAGEARTSLKKSLTQKKLAAERRHLERHPSFELPYGLAWLLALCAELRATGQWVDGLAPLETLAAERLVRFADTLTHPIRSGEHSQSAFAMSLAIDWADATGAHSSAVRLRARARDFHSGDAGWSLARFEPSGWDFLSPGLAAADLMRRALEQRDFAAWLTGALPEIPTTAEGSWLAVPASADPTDGKLVHTTGLVLSRAAMLKGIELALPLEDGRRASLHAARTAHLAAGIPAAMHPHYAGAHWLGTFAVYALTA